jgi:hypothetical protein
MSNNVPAVITAVVVGVVEVVRVGGSWGELKGEVSYIAVDS